MLTRIRYDLVVARRFLNFRREFGVPRAYGIIATTRITDDRMLKLFAEATDREMRLGDLSARAKVQTVEAFISYLTKQARAIAKGRA
ncbi:hypothetical protein, partial [Mesorhizobium sp. M4B.F.Ca.ET.143.01.1.1]